MRECSNVVFLAIIHPFEMLCARKCDFRCDTHEGVQCSNRFHDFFFAFVYRQNNVEAERMMNEGIK